MLSDDGHCCLRLSFASTSSGPIKPACFGIATFVSRAGEEGDVVHSGGQGKGEVDLGDHVAEGEPWEYIWPKVGTYCLDDVHHFSLSKAMEVHLAC